MQTSSIYMDRRIQSFLTVAVVIFLLSACKEQVALKSVVNRQEKTNISSASVDVLPQVTSAVPGIELGYAWDSEMGEYLPNRCISFAPVEQTAQTSTITMSQISDQTDIMRHLNISASASLKTVVASGSMHASLMRDVHISGKSTTFMLHAKVTNGVISAGPASGGYHARKAFPPLEGLERPFAKSEPQTPDNSTVMLTPWAQKLFNKSEAGFKEKCGDSYISQIQSGADVVSLFSFTSKSSEHKEAVEASLKAKYLGGQVSSKLSEHTETQFKETDIRMHYIQLGGGGGILPIQEKDLSGKLSTLTLEAESNPRFHTMTITPYPTVSHTPKDPIYEAIAEYYWVLSYVANEMRAIQHTEAKGLWYPPSSGQYYWYIPPDAPLQESQLGHIDRIEAVRALIYRAIHSHYKPSSATATEKINAPIIKKAGYQIFKNWPSPPAVPPENIALDKNFLEFLRKLLPPGTTNPHTLKLLLSAPLAACPSTEYLTGEMFVVTMAFTNGSGQCFSPNQRMQHPLLNHPLGVGSLLVQWYLMPQSDRACMEDPSSHLCMDFSDYKNLISFLRTQYSPGKEFPQKTR